MYWINKCDELKHLRFVLHVSINNYHQRLNLQCHHLHFWMDYVLLSSVKENLPVDEVPKAVAVALYVV